MTFHRVTISALSFFLVVLELWLKVPSPLPGSTLTPIPCQKIPLPYIHREHSHPLGQGAPFPPHWGVPPPGSTLTHMGELWPQRRHTAVVNAFGLGMQFADCSPNSGVFICLILGLSLWASFQAPGVTAGTEQRIPVAAPLLWM